MRDEIGLKEEQIEGLYLAATIHDVGKINVPAELLSKPGKLTSLEYQILQTHVQTGYEIIKGIKFPWPIAQIILQHHERLDGSGYPQGLKDEAILPEAKILSVADVMEAMLSHRPYRPALGLDAALAEIEAGKGRLYDQRRSKPASTCSGTRASPSNEADSARRPVTMSRRIRHGLASGGLFGRFFKGKRAHLASNTDGRVGGLTGDSLGADFLALWARKRIRGMPSAVKLRDGYSAEELRALAKLSKDANQSRRLLSLAAVRDGMERGEAAKQHCRTMPNVCDPERFAATTESRDRFQLLPGPGKVDRRSVAISRS